MLDILKVLFSSFYVTREVIKIDFLGVSITEWVGYLASAVLLVSFTMKDMRKLRMVNSAGAVLFVVYGFMLATSWPIVITNVAILGINMYYLAKRKS